MHRRVDSLRPYPILRRRSSVSSKFAPWILRLCRSLMKLGWGYLIVGGKVTIPTLSIPLGNFSRESLFRNRPVVLSYTLSWPVPQFSRNLSNTSPYVCK